MCVLCFYHVLPGLCNLSWTRQDGPREVGNSSGMADPVNRKQLQCFLGFAHFYCRFIRNTVR